MIHLRISIVLVALMALTFHADAATPATQGSSLAEQFKSVKQPAVDRQRLQDPVYREELQKEVSAYNAQRAELARQLLDTDPNGKEAPTYLEAVAIHLRVAKKTDEALEFIDKLQARTTSDDVKRECLYQRAVTLLGNPQNRAAFAEATDAFLAVAKADDHRGPMLLNYELQTAKSAADKKELSDRLVAKYPKSAEAQRITAAAKRGEQVGKPFELAFTDAIQGKAIDIKDLKGKVVVIDFWATWCGPCVGEMPEMKKIYAEYHAKGVEFLGVSLDQPEAQDGLKKLQDFCKDKEIPWPQYYQGNGWESQFSKSWGIDAIPAMFVVDADGNLSSIEARGKLRTILPELLAKRDRS